MRKLFFAINIINIALFSFNSAYGQRSLPKWDNFIKETETYKSDKAYALYSDYLSLDVNSTRSSLYYRLANHALNILENIDPIINANQFNYMAENTKNYYTKSLELLETADFRKDRDFFGIPTASKRLTEDEVKAQITPKLEGIDLFLNNTKEIQKDINALQKNYIDAYRQYLELNRKYITESEIYASWSSGLEQQLNSIILSFENVRQNASDYRNSLIQQPTKGYAANYTYKEINAFREDGLTITNFTRGPLWDYGAWASKTLKHYTGKVKPIIDKANIVLSEINTNIADYKNRKETVTVEPDLYKELFSIDPNNPIIENLKFRSNRFNFLVSTNNKLNTPVFIPTEDLTSERMNYIQKLTKDYSELSSKKYTDYSNTDKLKDAILYNEALNSTREYIKGSKTSVLNTASLVYKKKSIPLTYGKGFYRATTAGYLTKNIVPAPNGGIYISGSVINEQGFAVAFAAYSDDQENVTWLQTTDFSKIMYDDCAMAIYPAEDGNCYVLVSSKSVADPTLTSHSVVGYNSVGEEILNILLPEKILPLGRMIKYNTEKKEFLLAFYGNGEDWYENNSKLIIQKITTENILKYRTEVPINGSVIEIIEKENDKLILIGSCTYLKTDAKEYRNKLSAFSLTLENGKIINQEVFDREKPYNIIDIFSTFNAISIIGQESEISGNPGTIYIQLTNSGDLVFTNKTFVDIRFDENE